jgi:hypothetical protein
MSKIFFLSMCDVKYFCLRHRIWYCFDNYFTYFVDRLPLLAGDLLSYMSIIRGAVPFYRVDQYDQHFRFRIAYNQTRTWSQIDGN